MLDAAAPLAARAARDAAQRVEAAHSGALGSGAATSTAVAAAEPLLQPPPPLAPADYSHLILVGDLHGQLAKTLQLWSRLEACVGAEAFSRAKIIFLGDFVDRGPDPAGVLTWLCGLGASHPHQRRVLLAGNHDFALAAFLGLLPCVDGAAADAAAHGNVGVKQFEPPLYAGPAAGGMHLQGRRYGGGAPGENVYDSESTFASYGVAYGDREALLAAMPDDHKALIAGLEWVHECALPPGCSDGGDATRLIAVHAGLDHAEDIDAQLAALRARGAPPARVPQLSGRHEVLGPHPQLAARQALCVSGHHAVLRDYGARLIIDSGGGIDKRPITAVVLPGRVHVASD